MKNKVINKFDRLVEKLLEEFSKIPNFNLFQTDKIGNHVFIIIAYRLAEIATFKDLVCNQFIPATNKAIHESKTDIQNSRYKSILRIDEIDFQETFYETIRLAYVGLFHKVGNYVNEMIKLPELNMGELYETDGTIVKLAKEI